jgi:DNA-binding transcriptional MerR regulator
MDIGQVRERTGLTTATLHHYEELGLVSPTGRVGLRRQYGDDVIEVLAVIVLCQQSGFSLAEIGELVRRRERAQWKALARLKLAEIETRLSALEQARDGLRHAIDCPSPDIMRCEHFRARLDKVF